MYNDRVVSGTAVGCCIIRIIWTAYEISDHCAKFHGDRSTELWDPMAKTLRIAYWPTIMAIARASSGGAIHRYTPLSRTGSFPCTMTEQWVELLPGVVAYVLFEQPGPVMPVLSCCHITALSAAHSRMILSPTSPMEFFGREVITANAPAQHIWNRLSIARDGEEKCYITGTMYMYWIELDCAVFYVPSNTV